MMRWDTAMVERFARFVPDTDAAEMFTVLFFS